jgi:hypothetical protein
MSLFGDDDSTRVRAQWSPKTSETPHRGAADPSRAGASASEYVPATEGPGAWRVARGACGSRPVVPGRPVRPAGCRRARHSPESRSGGVMVLGNAARTSS